MHTDMFIYSSCIRIYHIRRVSIPHAVLLRCRHICTICVYMMYIYHIRCIYMIYIYYIHHIPHMVFIYSSSCILIYYLWSSYHIPRMVCMYTPYIPHTVFIYTSNGVHIYLIWCSYISRITIHATLQRVAQRTRTPTPKNKLSQHATLKSRAESSHTLGLHTFLTSYIIHIYRIG